MDHYEAKRAVVTVGGGRGFVVQGEFARYIITAGHCLPFIPPCISLSNLEERTYQALLGPLGERQSVSAECIFVDPISDIAVLASPDNQEMSEQADAYEAFTEASSILAINDLQASSSFDPLQNSPAWLLSLDGHWFQCEVASVRAGAPLWIKSATKGIMDDMSGSPILDDDGSAIGVVCCSSGGTGGRMLVPKADHSRGSHEIFRGGS